MRESRNRGRGKRREKETTGHAQLSPVCHLHQHRHSQNKTEKNKEPKNGRTEEKGAKKQKIDREEDKHCNISLVSFSPSLETLPATTTQPLSTATTSPPPGNSLPLISVSGFSSCMQNVHCAHSARKKIITRLLCMSIVTG